MLEQTFLTQTLGSGASFTNQVHIYISLTYIGDVAKIRGHTLTSPPTSGHDPASLP